MATPQIKILIGRMRKNKRDVDAARTARKISCTFVTILCIKFTWLVLKPFGHPFSKNSSVINLNKLCMRHRDRSSARLSDDPSLV